MIKERKQQAQYLLTRFVEGNISGSEETMLFQLLNEEADSEEWQEMIEELMAAEPLMTDYNKKEWQSVVDEILRSQNNGQKQPAKLRTMRSNWRRIAAAAVIILFIGGYWFYQNNAKQQPATPAVAKAKDVEAPKDTRAVITLADGRKVPIDSIVNGTLATQANITVQKTADGQIVYQPTNGIATQVVYNTLTNPRGSKVIDMQFTDGSHVWLNAGSSVKFPVAFIGSERKVFITGEAYFEVAHDASHPFRVAMLSAPGVSKGEVEVLGTHFNVNAYDDEDAIRVTLLQGSVKVSNRGGTAIIKPGEQATMTSNLKPRTSNDPDLDEVMAWKNGVFQFKNAPIDDIMRDVSRWYDVDVVYQGSIKQTFNGKIPRTVNASDLFKILESTGWVHFKIEGRKVTVMP